MGEGRVSILTLDEVFELLARLQAEGFLVMDHRKILLVTRRGDRYNLFLEGCMLVSVKIEEGGKIGHVEIDAWCVCRC